MRDPKNAATLVIPARRPIAAVYIFAPSSRSPIASVTGRTEHDLSYRNALRPLGAAEDSWLAEVPDLSGRMSDGETPQEAAEKVIDAIACWIEAAAEDGRLVLAPANADEV